MTFPEPLRYENPWQPVLITIIAAALSLASCERSGRTSGSFGWIDDPKHRVSYVVDNGSGVEAQRVLLVVGKVSSWGLDGNSVSWERGIGDVTMEEEINPADRVWIVGEDDSVTAIPADPMQIASLIESSKGSKLPDELTALIQAARKKSPHGETD